MAVIGDTLPHCTGTGTQADPYIFNTEQGFVEAIAVEACYAEAGQSNLTFDCNNGIITTPILISCAYLDCKGLTIFNALVNQSRNTVIKLADATNNNFFSREINNLNVYNFCIIYYGNNEGSGLLHTADYEVYGSFNYKATFNNCNFAGITIGYFSMSSPMVGKILIRNNQHNHLQLFFNNCTFNFHFSDPTNTDSTIKLISGSNASPVILTNCAISVSGTVPNKAIIMQGTDLQHENYAKFDTITVTNNQNNPLICKHLRFIMPQSGYNYYKLYVTTRSVSSQELQIKDNLGLINKSRLHTYWDTDSDIIDGLSGIVMQETDPSASDYIYDQQKLADAGFMVGQVIT